MQWRVTGVRPMEGFTLETAKSPACPALILTGLVNLALWLPMSLSAGNRSSRGAAPGPVCRGRPMLLLLFAAIVGLLFQRYLVPDQRRARGRTVAVLRLFHPSVQAGSRPTARARRPAFACADNGGRQFRSPR